MRKILRIRNAMLFIFFITCSITMNGQDDKFKAIFIYNFTKYVDWPPKPGNFIISVMGNDPITTEIQGIAAKRTVGSANIEIKNLRSISELSNCHILYVPDNKTELLSQIIPKANELNILVITEFKDACKLGSCINFVTSAGKISYEISETNIKSKGLKVSSDLMTLGIKVN